MVHHIETESVVSFTYTCIEILGGELHGLGPPAAILGGVALWPILVSSPMLLQARAGKRTQLYLFGFMACASLRQQTETNTLCTQFVRLNDCVRI